MTELGVATKSYTSRGWAVVPLHPIENGACTSRVRERCPRKKAGKHPRTLNGVDAATTNLAVIRSLWTPRPNANIGIATGRLLKNGFQRGALEPHKGNGAAAGEREPVSTQEQNRERTHHAKHGMYHFHFW
jgi:hypothetical protein